MPRFGWLSALLFLIIAFFFVAPSASDPPSKKRTTHQVMRDKLSLSQQLLHSVVIEDYATVERQSNELAELTREAAWMAHRTDQYRLESVEFERSAYQLAAAAREKRLSETTLGFLGVTLSCVRCHRYLREADEIQSREITIPPVAELSDDNAAKSVWMKKKLELSEAVLAGLAVGDAESIEKNAQTMQTLGSIEGWARRKDVQEYRALLDSFRAANQELIASAAKKDLDSSALAFTQVMLNCVKCHQHLRDGEKPQE
jgi:cytochrome c556